MRKHSRKRRSTRKQSKIATMMILVAVILVCVASAIRVSNLYAKSSELADTEYLLEQRIAEAELESQNLEAQYQYMQTKKYIEDVAKDKLGLVYPDEIVIKPSD